MRQEGMAEQSSKSRRRGPVALRELIGGIIDPLTAKRGFATADLIASWPDIVGPALAGWTAPEKIVWPRGNAANEASAGVLHLRVDGPRAIFVQHEIPQIRERLNGFFGYAAIGQIRIVQGRVAGKAPKTTSAAPIGADKEALLAGRLVDIESETLKAALDRLGRGVLASRRD